MDWFSPYFLLIRFSFSSFSFSLSFSFFFFFFFFFFFSFLEDLVEDGPGQGAVDDTVMGDVVEGKNEDVLWLVILPVVAPVERDPRDVLIAVLVRVVDEFREVGREDVLINCRYSPSVQTVHCHSWWWYRVVIHVVVPSDIIGDVGMSSFQQLESFLWSPTFSRILN